MTGQFGYLFQIYISCLMPVWQAMAHWRRNVLFRPGSTKTTKMPRFETCHVGATKSANIFFGDFLQFHRNSYIAGVVFMIQFQSLKATGKGTKVEASTYRPSCWNYMWTICSTVSYTKAIESLVWQKGWHIKTVPLRVHKCGWLHWNWVMDSFWKLQSDGQMW